MLKNFLTAILFAVLSLSIAAEKLDVPVNFQPRPGGIKGPIGWAWNEFAGLYGKVNKGIKVRYSATDNSGYKSINLDIPQKSPRFDLFSANRFSSAKGDVLIVSCEAKGKGKVGLGGYSYGKMSYLGELFQYFNLTDDYKTYRAEITIPSSSKGAPAFLRVAMTFRNGGNFTIRNFRAEYKKSKQNLADAELKKFRYYPIYKLSGKPAVTPNGSPEIWSQIPRAKGFELLKNGKFQQQSGQTSFQMGHYNNVLYIRVVCNEKDFSAIPVNDNNYRDGYVYDDQSEFAITHDRNVMQSYFVFNSMGSNFRLGQIRTFQSKCIRTKDQWITLLELPFATLLPENQKVNYGQKYFFNVGRSNFVDGTLTWSSYAPGFGDRKKFATCIFYNSLPGAPAAKIENDINLPYYEYLGYENRMLALQTDKELKRVFNPYGTLKEEHLRLFAEMRKRGSQENTPDNYESNLRKFQDLYTQLRHAVKPVTIEIDKPDDVKKLYVNGVPHAVGKKITLKIKEGISVIAAQTVPGTDVTIRIAGHPEADNRWRTTASQQKNQNWTSPSFNDTKWQVAPLSANKKAVSKGFVRQIILWNRTHYGDERLFPKTREWYIAKKSVDGARIAIYSPLAYNLRDFTVTLEMPSDLTIIKAPPFRTLRSNRVPKKITSQKISANSHSYTLFFNDKAVPANRTEYYFLQMDFTGSGARKADELFHIRYYRRANGNFTELAVDMPCRVLPEINGRQPRKFKLISAGDSAPYSSDEYYYKLIEQFRNTGFNSAFVHGADGTSPNGYYERTIQSLERFHKLNISAETTMMSPMWGCHFTYGALYQYLANHPEHQAKRLNPAHTFGKPAQWWNFMYCPSFMSGEGKEIFISLFKEDLRNLVLGANPFCDYIWTNWEGKPWGKDRYHYCFCERCIKIFRTKYKIPASKKLTPELIRTHYYNEWFDFRTGLDADMANLIKNVIQSFGVRHMIYSQTAQTELWKKFRDKIDIPQPGVPGNGPGLSRSQSAEMDYAMDLIRKSLGYEYLVGQQIAMNFIGNTGKHGYRKEFLASVTEFMEPKIFKSVFLRMAASLHGGIMWWGEPVYGAFDGIHYYMGEATRIIAEYEPLFLYGKRVEKTLLKSENIKYPMVLVLERKKVPMPAHVKRKHPSFRRVGSERLVLLFNETDQAQKVTFENIGLSQEAFGKFFESKETVSPHKVTTVIPPWDVKVLHIYNPEN